MVDNPVRIVKELKGAPLSVMMALFFAGGMAVNQEWIERNTGYSDKPISKALAYLQEHQFIVKTRSGWRLSDGAKQLPLPFMPLEDVAAEHGLADEVEACEEPELDTNCLSRNNSDSPINIKEIDIKENLNNLNINSETRNYSDSEVGQTLMGVGIMANWRTLKLLGRISVGDVREMRSRMQTSGMSLDDTGYMIRILEGMAEQNDRKNGQDRNSLQRYADWES